MVVLLKSELPTEFVSLNCEMIDGQRVLNWNRRNYKRTTGQSFYVLDRNRI